MSLDIWVWNFPLHCFVLIDSPPSALAAESTGNFKLKNDWRHGKYHVTLFFERSDFAILYVKNFGGGGCKSISSFFENFPHFSKFFQNIRHYAPFVPKITNTYRNIMGNSPKNELNMDASGNVVWPTVGRTTDRPTNERPLLCLLQMRWPIVDRISDLNRLIDYC